MFDKLFELLRTIWNELVPWFVVADFESSCVLRFGKFNRVVNAGLHYKIPFVDTQYTYHIRTATSHLSSQTLTTSDNKSIVIKVIVRYNIEDIKKYTLNVWSAHDAIGDTVQGIINNIVKVSTWEKIMSGIEEEATIQAQEALSMWGIKIEKITLSDLGIIKTIRLLNNYDTSSNQTTAH